MNSQTSTLPFTLWRNMKYVIWTYGLPWSRPGKVDMSLGNLFNHIVNNVPLLETTHWDLSASFSATKGEFPTQPSTSVLQGCGLILNLIQKGFSFKILYTSCQKHSIFYPNQGPVIHPEGMYLTLPDYLAQWFEDQPGLQIGSIDCYHNTSIEWYSKKQGLFNRITGHDHWVRQDQVLNESRGKCWISVRGSVDGKRKIVQKWDNMHWSQPESNLTQITIYFEDYYIV